MIKSFEDFQAMGKEGFDAYVSAATVWTRGMQEIAAESADFTRASFEKGAAAAEKVLAAKSVEKAFEVQQGFAKDAYDGFVGQANKVGEIYMNTAKEAFKPVEKQVQKFAADKKAA